MTDTTRALEATFYVSVSEIAELWDKTIGKEHPYKGAAFLKCVESTFDTRKFAYCALKEGEDIVALAVLSHEQFDLALRLPPWALGPVRLLRRWFPRFCTVGLAMVGTMETAENHWWFDKSRLDFEQFASQLHSALRGQFPNSSLLIIRDFSVTESDEQFLDCFIRLGFKRATGLPLAVLDVGDTNLDAYLSRLRSKPRAAIRKMLRIASAEGLVTERVSISSVLDDIYPLYLATHDKAKEYVRHPIPKQFFTEIDKRLADKTSLLVTRNRDSRIIGFMLTGFNGEISNPFLIGFNYEWTHKYSLYYNLMYHELIKTLEQRCKTVDMGLTNYFIKQGLGASLRPLHMACRFNNEVLHKLLGNTLPYLLAEPQPDVRRRYNTE